MIALVEPPSAIAAVTAFSNASVVRISLGVRVSQTISTIRRPLALAILACDESGAGIEDAPGSVSPSASTAAAMVEAVPIVMHVPYERAIPSSISRQEHSSNVPARRSAQYFHTSLPDPEILPRQVAGSIGPGGPIRGGQVALVAPITSAGTV